MMETSITCKKSGIPVPRTINRNRSFQSSLSIDLDDSTNNNHDIEPSIMSYSFNSNEKKPPSRVTQMVSRFSDSKPVSPINKIEVPVSGMTRTIQRKFSESREDKPPQIPQVPETDSKTSMWKDKASSLMKMLESEKQEKERLENVNQKLTQVIKSLNNERPEMKELKEQNLKIRKTLDNILPDTFKREGIQRINSLPEFVTPQELEYLINEIETLKTNHNNLELQLYEANEKISDMIEQKQQLEQENQRLTIENAEFNQVARLVTDNMKESMDTNKRMDETFYRVKAHRDELIKANRDSCDGATSPGLCNNGPNEVKKLKAELEIQEAKYKAQFIEYQKTMEAELAKNTNEQISQYRVRMDLMEKDLADALKRAERAEKELLELRKHLRECVDSDQEPPVMAAPIPVPPPPPPLPPSLKGPFTTKYNTSIVNQKLQQHESTTPIKKQSATGLDAVIDDLKNGRATLRRRPALHNQSSSSNKLNPILREMYELLEKSKQRNRNSKLLVENESISLAFDIQALNI